MVKIYTVIKERRGRTTEEKGTMSELLDYFGYTLECGKSWEHEKGNSKINLNSPCSGSGFYGCPTITKKITF
jgi:hypothetical protein